MLKRIRRGVQRCFIPHEGASQGGLLLKAVNVVLVTWLVLGGYSLNADQWWRWLCIAASAAVVYWWTHQGGRRAAIVYDLWQEQYRRPRPRWRRWLELFIIILLAQFVGPFVRPWSRPHLERLVLAFLLAVGLCVVLIVLRP